MRLRRWSVVGGSTSSPTRCPFGLTVMEDVSYLPSCPDLRNFTRSLSTNQGPLRIFPRETQYVCMPTACSLRVISDVKHSCTHIRDVYTHTHTACTVRNYFYDPGTKQAELPLSVMQGVSRMITWERKLLSGRENWRKRSFSKGERLPRQEALHTGL